MIMAGVPACAAVDGIITMAEKKKKQRWNKLLLSINAICDSWLKLIYIVRYCG